MPGDGWAGGLDQGLVCGGGGHDGQGSAGEEEADGVGDGGFHSVDGAESNAVELALDGFSAGRVDRCGKGEGTDGFVEECGFLALGFGEGDGDLGAANGDGDAGKASSGAIVEKGAHAGRQGVGAGDRLDEVTGKNLFGATNGSEVGAGVPALNQLEVLDEEVKLAGSQIREICIEEERGEAVSKCGIGGVHGRATDSAIRRGW